jgi:4-amino-4-deoxy-L-arabinose transferase-like glycosyltransferase
MKKKYNTLLGLILLIGLFIRTVGIADVNSGFYVDEASIGYNAKSILETGSDEYGQNFPLAFRSFGDYKSPLFVYANIPLVSVFGSAVGARLTSAILGVITIWLVAEITRKLSGGKAGLLAGIILATLPWHANLSRHGVEPVLSSVLLSGAILCFMNKRRMLGFLGLALSTLAYHSTKYISPILALLILIIMKEKKINKNKIGKILVGLVWVAVMIINIQGFSNFRALGVISINGVVASYLSYFNPKVLMLGDRITINNIYGISNVSVVVVFLFFIGAWQVVKMVVKNNNRSNFLLLIFVLLLSPLPASATIDPFHAIRALTMVVPLSIFAGIGGEWIINKSHLRGVILVVMVLVGFQVFSLSEKILVQNKLMAYEGWIGGYEQLINEVMKLDTSGFTKVVVDTTDRPADYSLWQVFGKVDTKQKIPLPLQHKYYDTTNWQGPESLILENGLRVFFKPVYWPDDQRIPNTLYVGSVWRFDPDAIKRAGAEVVVEVKDPTGKVVWMAVATKKI